MTLVPLVICRRGIVFTLFAVLVVLSIMVASATASAAPARVGACLAAKDTLPPRPNEDVLDATWNALNDVANAFTASPAASSAFELVIANTRDSSGDLPAPETCDELDKDKSFAFWIAIIHAGNGTFVFEVSQRKGDIFVVIGPDDSNAHLLAEAKSILKSFGEKLTVKASPPPIIPIEDVQAMQTGVIVLIDDSGSMANNDEPGADPGHVNRLAVATTIVESLENVMGPNVKRPIPFAFVLFSEKARKLEKSPGQPFFMTTPNDLAQARELLDKSLLDVGRTDLGAAISEAGRLIQSKTDVARWHVVLFTDGVPTIGETDYAKLTSNVTKLLGPKTALSSVALHGTKPGQTQDEDLLKLVEAVADGAGRVGEIINLRSGDDPAVLKSGANRIAYLIGQSSLRAEVTLKCANDNSGSEYVCTVDKTQPLRFGAVRKRVTFVADITAFGTSGRCAVKVSNRTFRDKPIEIALKSGEMKVTSSDDELHIELSRTSNRVFILLESNPSIVIKGDWDVEVRIIP